MQGDYLSCLNLLQDAESDFGLALVCAQEIGDTLYGRAAVLLKMQRWNEALEVAGNAETTYEREGDRPGATKARFLLGCILNDQGFPDRARTVLLSLRKAIEGRGDREMHARLWLSLASCDVRRGDAVSGRQWLNKAKPAILRLDARSENARAMWCGGMLSLLEGHLSEGDAEIREAMTAFRELGMAADAAFVGMDLLAHLVRTGSRRNRMDLAREIAETLIRAGASVGAAEALDYLRKAVKDGSADAELVNGVKRFLRHAEVYRDDRFEKQ
jgi:tetratricopeptide (TPR) repeat protein